MLPKMTHLPKGESPQCLIFGYPTPLPQNGGALEARNTLTKMVKRHPQLHSKLEELLEDVLNKLET